MPEHSLTPYRKVELQDASQIGLPTSVGFVDLSSLSESLGFVDITKQLGSSEVRFEEGVDLISQVEFTIKHGATYWIENIQEGLRCRLTAGYAANLPFQATKRTFFDGIVTSFSISLPDNGKPELRVVCQDQLYQLTKSAPGRITYPGIKIDNHPPPYSRDFHLNGKAQTVSFIIEGILKEHGIAIKQISIDKAHDYEFQVHNPISQNEDETDLEFIQRLLTGRSNRTQKQRGKKDQVNHLVNARAKMWMEVDPIDQTPKVHVVAESKLLGDVGDATFVYQTPGALSVEEGSYNPLSHEAELVIRSVSLRENKEDAQGKEVQHRQDVKKRAKGRKAVGQAASPTDPINQGAQRKDVVSSGDGEPPPADLAFNYRINESLVLRDIKAGILPSGFNLLAATSSGQLKWKQVKKYFTPRVVSNVPSARTLPGGKPIPRQATTPTGFTGGVGKGSGGKGAKGTQGSGEQVQEERIKKYGQTLSFGTHGNLFVLCRRSYPVKFPFGRYSGNWFAIKVTHRWGNTYTMNVEMGR